MGNSSNKDNPGELHKEAKLYASRFDENELFILKKTYEDLAERTNGKGVDKETFLQYFPLSGLLGDRLFATFDTKHSNFVSFDDFVCGLAICSRGTLDEKIHFIFNMYDIGHCNTVSKQEMLTLLNHVPTWVLHSEELNITNVHSDDAKSSTSESHAVPRSRSPSDRSDAAGYVATSEEEAASVADSVDEVNEYTNYDVVEKAFEVCDLNHEGRLTYEEFKMWVERTPAILDYMESILPFVGRKEDHSASQKEVLPMGGSALRTSRGLHKSKSSMLEPPMGQLTKTSSFDGGLLSDRDRTTSMSSLQYYAHNAPGTRITRQSSADLAAHNRRGSIANAEMEDDAEDEVRNLLQQALEMTHNDALKQDLQDLLNNHFLGGVIAAPRLTTMEDFNRRLVVKEGHLWKKGGKFGVWTKRWYVLSRSCLYYYTHQNDVRPRGVIFLTGCIIEKVVDESSEMKGYFGIELMHQDLCTGEHHHRHDHRFLYTKSEEERESWIFCTQHSAQVIPIEDDYVIGKELGRGRFSRVCECINKVTGIRYAVKIIEKASMEPEEKALLRTEIAVLKLVNHPNIIKLEGLYETRTHMYIVMEKLTGGELFERIVGKPRFTEEEAARLIRSLLESVAYLHDLGIVHRDIKPENILCGETLDNIKIADFGLSKMLLPTERMDTACGTLSYVAPEVLTMRGYGAEADMWSVGVIMYLVLCGRLPFDGANQEEIIRNTIQGELKVMPVWSKLSEEARSLIQALLTKNPKDRVTARDSLRHPFLVKYHVPHHNHHSRPVSTSGRPPLNRDVSAGSTMSAGHSPSTPRSDHNNNLGVNGII